MFFWNNIIRSKFLEIRLYWDHEINETNEQNLIHDDEATINQDEFDGVQTNVNTELKSREGENLEEEDSSNNNSIISTNTETSNSNPFSTQNTRRGRVIWKPQLFWALNFETNLTATIYHNYYQVLENNETEEKDPEIAAVGAAIGGGFNHTSKLIPIKSKKQWLNQIKMNG